MASREFLKSLKYFIPRGGDKVYKDECLLCYDSPYSDGGLFVSLTTLQGFCQDHVKLFCIKHGKEAFLHLKKVRKSVDMSTAGEPEAKKPTRLAIGIEGGFDPEKDKAQYDDVNSVHILEADGTRIEEVSLPSTDLPEMTLMAVSAILSHQGASMLDNIAAWEGDKRMVSKHANDLLQLDNGVKVPPSGWKCSKCDLVDNLWMNLTDGTILCGRRYFDGSGGNNHAIEYYAETKYPLAVKLGTITSDGADVFSYEEDNMVEDPKLEQHLAHFGINIFKMEKTDKTMTELEIEANMKLKAEWDNIQESGRDLKPMHGPSYTGMINLGNSCYMNSVMQVLFTTPEFQARRKLANGLLSGKYSAPGDDGETERPGQGIRPSTFKSIVAEDHIEFRTNRQQDAFEYLLHLLTLISRKEHSRSSKTDLRSLFALEFEDRLQCLASNKVSYSKREDVSLMLRIPIEKATNVAEYKAFEEMRKEKEANKEKIDSSQIVRLNVSMTDCIESFAQAEILDSFCSSAVKEPTQASRTTRFASFPDYLIVQMRKFTVDDNWIPRKLDVSVDVPDELDLSHLRGTGLQPGEEELPKASTLEPEEPNIDENMVQELAAMGFVLEGCRKAVYNTKNSGIESAMEWILQHMDDADFADRLELPSAKKSNFQPNEEALGMIQSMGFTKEQATKALKSTDNNVERAVDWIFSHPDELNAEEMEVDDDSRSAGPKFSDGPGKYRLFAFISHMGTSTSCGHYVCHIYKEGRWIIYNDRKVAVSEKPPRDLAYIYFYKRAETS
eukprot:gene7232-12915_t